MKGFVVLFNRITFVFLILFLVASCSVNREVDDNVVLEVNKNKSLVFLSLTRSGTRDVPFYLMYRGVEENNRFVKGEISLLGIDDWVSSSVGPTTSKGDFEGRIVVLSLPVGKYEFYALIIEDGYQNAEWSGGGRFSYSFVSSDSTVEYAGNVHVWSREKDEDYDISYEYYRSDERVRDVPLFRKKSPEIEKIAYSGLSPLSSNLLKDYVGNGLTDEERRLLAFEPQDAESHKNRAFYYFSLGDYEKVEYHAKKAIEMDASLSDPYLYRALVFMKKENVLESIRFLNLSIDKNNDNGFALVIRAFLYGSIGNKKQARKDWDRAKRNSNELVNYFSGNLEIKKVLDSL